MWRCDRIINTHPVRAHACHYAESPPMPMTQQDVMDRIIWHADGYRYGYTTIGEAMNQIIDVIEANRETLR